MVASKTKARGATGAYSSRSEATRRRWEAVVDAGHVRAARSPELSTGDGGAVVRARKRLAQVDQQTREGEASLLVRFAWPVAA
jgi:hypothetical protein